MEIELERTFLLKKFPVDLGTLRSVEVFDIYIPKSASHSHLRIRKKGDKFEITKKHPVEGKDSSHLSEETIPLTEKEFTEFTQLEGRRVRKIRYYYQFGANTAEIDVFQDGLEGLILVDFEFKTSEEESDFMMPDFCLAEVTQEKFTAGGVLAGKKYEDLEEELGRYNYRKF